MNRKLPGMYSPKSKKNLEPRSAFEMSINLEFQGDLLTKGTGISKAGDPCPECQSAPIDYDGMLNLHCPECGYTLAGCFT